MLSAIFSILLAGLTIAVFCIVIFLAASLPIIAASLVPLLVLALPLLLLMAVIWLLGLPSERRARRHRTGDTHVVENVHRGLARMENRLSTLETIILDRPRR